MSLETMESGEEFIINQVKKETRKKDINIKDYTWVVKFGRTELEIRTDRGAAYQKFTNKDLRYCQTKIKYRVNVAAKITNILIQLER